MRRCLTRIFRIEIKTAMRAGGMTDADIDAELTAYNAERRI